MKPPETYAEWSAAFATLETDDFSDGEVLPALEAGQISWCSGVAERFTLGFAAVFNARLKRANVALQRDLDIARGAEIGVANAMLGARRRLQPLTRLAALSALPENVRKHFRSELQTFVNRAQSSLEDSAIAADRTGRLRSIFRHNPLSPFASPPLLAAAPAAESASPPALTGRRVILK